VDFEQWLGQVDPRRPINYVFIRDYKEAVKAIWKQTDQGSCTQHTHITPCWLEIAKTSLAFENLHTQDFLACTKKTSSKQPSYMMPDI